MHFFDIRSKMFFYFATECNGIGEGNTPKALKKKMPILLLPLATHPLNNANSQFTAKDQRLECSKESHALDFSVLT